MTPGRKDIELTMRAKNVSEEEAIRIVYRRNLRKELAKSRACPHIKGVVSELINTILGRR